MIVDFSWRSFVFFCQNFFSVFSWSYYFRIVDNFAWLSHNIQTLLNYMFLRLNVSFSHSSTPWNSNRDWSSSCLTVNYGFLLNLLSVNWSCHWFFSDNWSLNYSLSDNRLRNHFFSDYWLRDDCSLNNRLRNDLLTLDNLRSWVKYLTLCLTNQLPWCLSLCLCLLSKLYTTCLHKSLFKRRYKCLGRVSILFSILYLYLLQFTISKHLLQFFLSYCSNVLLISRGAFDLFLVNRCDRGE